MFEGFELLKFYHVSNQEFLCITPLVVSNAT